MAEMKKKQKPGAVGGAHFSDDGDACGQRRDGIDGAQRRTGTTQKYSTSSADVSYLYGLREAGESTQKYMLTYKVVNMAGKILERMDILQIAKPYLERLSDLSGEAVHLVQREGNNILYIYKIEAKVGTIRMVSHVGMVHPMYCSGVGKAIMATLPEAEVRQDMG